MPLKLKEYLTIGDVDKDGDVEINMENSHYGDTYVYLNQNEIKELIEFLQKQLRPS